MSSISELLASFYVKEPGDEITKDALKKFADYLGVDSLIYQKIDNIPKAIGLPKENLCMACLNAKYPTEYGKILYGKAIETNFLTKRVYE
jgi:amidophosphoribosyltransferase